MTAGVVLSIPALFLVWLVTDVPLLQDVLLVLAGATLAVILIRAR